MLAKVSGPDRGGLEVKMRVAFDWGHAGKRSAPTDPGAVSPVTGEEERYWAGRMVVELDRYADVAGVTPYILADGEYRDRARRLEAELYLDLVVYVHWDSGSVKNGRVFYVSDAGMHYAERIAAELAELAGRPLGSVRAVLADGRSTPGGVGLLRCPKAPAVLLELAGVDQVRDLAPSLPGIAHKIMGAIRAAWDAA